MLDYIATFFARFVELFAEAGIFVLFGLAVAGLLHVFVPESLLLRFLGKGKYAPVVKAALIGLPLPLCSCGVLPAAIGFRRQGACKGATVAFLISTPETSVDSIAISFALLNPIMAIFRPIAAFVTALLSGFACNVIPTGESAKTKREAHMPACCALHGAGAGAPIVRRLRHGARFAFVEMVADLGWWLVMGVAIAALILTIFPTGYLADLPGGPFVVMLAMLVVGVPLYMCSTASTPIAAGLIAAGVSPGAALVLLLVGPATNAASITVVARELGKKTTAIYLASLAAVSLSMGLALDAVYGWFVQGDVSQSVRAGAEALPAWLTIGGAVVFGALLAANLAMRLFGKKTCACCGADGHDREDRDHCDCGHDHGQGPLPGGE